MGRKQNMINTSEFYCIFCGQKGIPIMRRRGNEREAGHLKKLYCVYCQKETNHVECKPFTHYEYKDFQLERQYNNFDEDGNRKIQYGLFKDDLYKKGLI